MIGPGTEATLFALGLGDQLGGVSDFCTVAAAAALPRVGGQANPNMERIAALTPRLVLVQGMHPKLEEWCAGAGVEFHAFRTDSVSAWTEEVLWIGKKFGVLAEAEAEIARMHRALADLRGTGPTRRTLLVVSRRAEEASGILGAGPGTFLSELLVAAGGVNVLPPGSSAYPEVNEESLIRLDPETIIEFTPGGADDALTIWTRSFPAMSAVRARRVSVVHHSEALIPGPRMDEVARAIAALLR